MCPDSHRYIAKFSQNQCLAAVSAEQENCVKLRWLVFVWKSGSVFFFRLENRKGKTFGAEDSS